ncbi:MAG: UDP-glucose--hexose-1-phosphate uridylyltransferase [Ekhidna sp.]|nr:UDP-glucose--hexose-1-phosphate uridylyltransferase [Ekhidna sp.]MBC6425714.1 UDP-glucose--hexose-1-phosphate uridylyltransferase [Ekhidna sp.]
MNSLNKYSHRRYNPLIDEWVLVSPHRMKRPWHGQKENINDVRRPVYDEECYLCPGNTRAGGMVNAHYTTTFSFQNDFSSIQEEIEEFSINDGLLKAKSEKGICKVICFSPRHDLTLPELSIDEITSVIQLWKRAFWELGSKSFINHVQIFENKGEVMGCSNPHPHGQIWAQESIPVEAAKKTHQQNKYFNEKGKTMLSAYIEQELNIGDRVLYENEYMVVLIPFWAIWPYEAMIIPKEAASNLLILNEQQEKSFAEALKWLTVKYDNLFETSFPYSCGVHQAPTDGKSHPEWHWHMSFYPPLLRSASVKKFMVGYELFADPQRDITAEQVAQKFLELPDVHYSERK